MFFAEVRRLVRRGTPSVLILRSTVAFVTSRRIRRLDSRGLLTLELVDLLLEHFRPRQIGNGRRMIATQGTEPRELLSFDQMRTQQRRLTQASMNTRRFTPCRRIAHEQRRECILL